VATLGTATTPLHITKLTRQTDDIVFCFDGDAAGRKAAWRAALNALPAVTDGLRLSFLFLPPEHDPDTYVREFGREGFEAALQGALTLSAYLLQELSERHDLGSQEGRVRFLGDAKPILQQVQAQGLSLMLRKRVAELAGITQAEIENLLKLEAPKRQSQTPGKAPRRAPTLSRKLLQLLVIRPPLALQMDVGTLPVSMAEHDAIARSIELVQSDPAINSAALMQELRGSIPEKLLGELAGELVSWDEEEDFDVEQEFAGVLRQLQGASQQREVAVLLQMAQERGLQALSPEQREQLQQYRRSDAQK
jgi:DNA primase